MRPVDADDLLEIIEKYCGDYDCHDSESFDKQAVRMAIRSAPTLTPPNEWVNVEDELPEDKQIVLFHQKNGFIYCAEYFAGNKLLSPAWFIDNDCWEAGEVTHWMPLPAPPDKGNNVPIKAPNEPLTQADLDSMNYDKVWIDYGDDGEWALAVHGRIYSLANLEGCGFEDILRDEVAGETVERPSGDYTVYRRPPEGEA